MKNAYIWLISCSLLFVGCNKEEANEIEPTYPYYLESQVGNQPYSFAINKDVTEYSGFGASDGNAGGTYCMYTGIKFNAPKYTMRLMVYPEYADGLYPNDALKQWLDSQDTLDYISFSDEEPDCVNIYGIGIAIQLIDNDSQTKYVSNLTWQGNNGSYFLKKGIKRVNADEEGLRTFTIFGSYGGYIYIIDAEFECMLLNEINDDDSLRIKGKLNLPLWSQ